MNNEIKSQKITIADYVEASRLIGLETAVIQAVAEVESGKYGAFLPDGRPTILFEGHIFWRLLRQSGKNPQSFITGNEDILYPHWTKAFYRGGAAEYDRLRRAVAIDEIAALSATSWGLFQIMGFNHGACGCKSAKTLKTAMEKDVKSQLLLWLSFLRSQGLVTFLKNHQWAEFACRYNGAGYKANHYDTRLATAYAHLLKP